MIDVMKTASSEHVLDSLRWHHNTDLFPLSNDRISNVTMSVLNILKRSYDMHISSLWSYYYSNLSFVTYSGVIVKYLQIKADKMRTFEYVFF